jgi:hypothetical protein
MTVEQPAQSVPAEQPQNVWVPGAGAPVMPGYAPAVPSPGTGPLGKVRGTGACMLLSIITLGIYSLVWFYRVHEEMKRHTGRGLGGAIALVLSIFIGAATPFLTSNEVGSLYESRGQAKPVSALTGLWYFPGIFILVGPIVWFVKTNGALNAYWRSLGAR